MRPDVVYVSISGFGQWGPDHERAGYDPLAQAASGFLSLNGEPDGEPVKSPTFLADDLAGLHAALAALAALRHRDRTGEGQHIDVALLDAMLFQSTGYLTLGALGVAAAAPRQPVPHRRARQHLPLPRRPDHGRRAARRALARASPAARAAPSSPTTRATRRRRRGSSAARRSTRCSPAGRASARSRRRSRRSAPPSVPAAPVRTYAEAARDPHVRARDMLQEVERRRRRASRSPGPAAKFSRTPLRVRTPPPRWAPTPTRSSPSSASAPRSAMRCAPRASSAASRSARD